MNIIDQLHRRYATKSFDPDKKLSDDQLHILTESMRLAPSSFGLQPWKFLVVTNPDIRTSLTEKARWQQQVSDASHLIVLCARDTITTQDVQKYIDDISTTRWAPLESLEWFKNSMNGSIANKSDEQLKARSDKQVYIAVWFLLIAAASIEVDACPMEGFDSAAFDQLLWLQGSGYHSTVVVPVWYRSGDDKYSHSSKVRYDADQVIEYIK